MIFPFELLEHLRSAKHIAVLTGAGISAESGIPTFRDAQTGLWSQYSPEELASPQAFNKNPGLVWEWYTWRKQLIVNAQPNPGHLSLVDMARRTPELTLITQNIDGLHQAAGSQQVIELHGNIYRSRCSVEGRLVYTRGKNDLPIPSCPFCGAPLRPDVVWFGEPLPEPLLQQAIVAAKTCNIFLIIGTSGIVQPAASLPLLAIHQGKPCVEINCEYTPLTPAMAYHFHGPAGVILPDLTNAVWPE